MSNCLSIPLRQPRTVDRYRYDPVGEVRGSGALSTQIAKLEGDLGTALLTRSSRRVDLTPAGRALLSEGRDLLRHAEATQARALRLKHAAWLRVGVHVTAFTETTSTLLRDFTAANPELSVEIQTYGLAEPAAGLLDGRSDIAVVRPPVAAPDLEFHVLGEESRVFVVPADDPLADRGVLTLDDVRGHAWVAAPAATDGTQPQVWRDFWLPPPLRDGQPATIGATATTLDAWREYVAAVAASACARPPANASTPDPASPSSRRPTSRPATSAWPGTPAMPRPPPGDSSTTPAPTGQPDQPGRCWFPMTISEQQDWRHQSPPPSCKVQLRQCSSPGLVPQTTKQTRAGASSPADPRRWS
jgi:DNA-binding transcriptional LysR family regulator